MNACHLLLLVLCLRGSSGLHARQQPTLPAYYGRVAKSSCKALGCLRLRAYARRRGPRLSGALLLHHPRIHLSCADDRCREFRPYIRPRSANPWYHSSMSSIFLVDPTGMCDHHCVPTADPITHAWLFLRPCMHPQPFLAGAEHTHCRACVCLLQRSHCLTTQCCVQLLSASP